MRIFLNGREIPATNIEPVDDGNRDLDYDLTPFLDWIRPGTNLVCVILNNTWQPDWDNVAFDLSLKAMPSSLPAPSPVRFNSIRADASGINLGLDCPPGSVWRVEYNDSFPNGGAWQMLPDVTNRTGSTVTFTDTGDAGRQSPRLPGSRFYRLQPR